MFLPDWTELLLKEAMSIILSTLQVRKLRPRNGKWLVYTTKAHWQPQWASRLDLTSLDSVFGVFRCTGSLLPGRSNSLPSHVLKCPSYASFLVSTVYSLFSLRSILKIQMSLRKCQSWLAPSSNDTSKKWQLSSPLSPPFLYFPLRFVLWAILDLRVWFLYPEKLFLTF